MFKIINNMQSTVEGIADKRTDVETIPTHYGAGSTCFVIEDSSVYMLGNDAKWHELNPTE